ncbi:MAG TPA: sporulation integral membrane protein YtvI [Candidatus Anaerostipes avistercoris]|uniref:Sporulation integral membrane protein YtvI n=1 Tax=Candidatus Anaerostipes avistercoris TaxID=2838462 RepID=A0A9D2T8L8_9FIRM|nr:sporulation integral membrane protein YtvI [uncultured Anaerostipes sp.]HJC49366.1 sporulation integral membrane protein YtvI [Candidatus Anaerostipes avistercoris]
MKRWEIYLDMMMELLVIAAGVVLLIFVVPRCLGFLWPFVAGWIIAMIAHPVIEYLEKKIRLPKKFGSVILIVAVVTAIIALFYFLIRGIVTQVLLFVQGFPDFQKDVMDQFEFFRQKIEAVLMILPPAVQNQLDHVVQAVGSGIASLVSGIGNYGVSHAGSMAKGMTNGLIGVVVMFFSSYMFLIDREKIIKWYRKSVPEVVKHKINIFLHNTLGVLGSYCLAQLKIMFIIILILWIGFKIAGISYAFLFAILIGIVDIFPILGTGTVIIPWAVFCIVTGNITRAVILLIVYAVCLILKQVLQPKMMGDSMGISALTTIFLIYVGWKIGGLGGMLLALIFGMFIINLYRLGIFDRKINFFRRRIEMLTINSETEEKEKEKE